jgi:hypothetical protein
VSVTRPDTGAAAPNGELWTFEQFEVGALIGSSLQRVDDEFIKSWGSKSAGSTVFLFWGGRRK